LDPTRGNCNRSTSADRDQDAGTMQTASERWARAVTSEGRSKHVAMAWRKSPLHVPGSRRSCNRAICKKTGNCTDREGHDAIAERSKRSGSRSPRRERKKAHAASVPFTVGGDDQQAYALHSMLLYFQWHEAQIIYATDTYGTAFAAELRAVSNSAHIRNETGVSFSSVISFQTGNVQSINQAIDAMEEDGGLIVIMLASYGDAVRMVAVEMARRGFMIGAIRHCCRRALSPFCFRAIRRTSSILLRLRGRLPERRWIGRDIE
jgi:hypothetical protein